MKQMGNFNAGGGGGMPGMGDFQPPVRGSSSSFAEHDIYSPCHTHTQVLHYWWKLKCEINMGKASITLLKIIVHDFCFLSNSCVFILQPEDEDSDDEGNFNYYDK